MNKARFVAMILTTALALSLTAAALAHQPFCEFADLTYDAPWHVPDPTISYAYFGNIYPAGDLDFFSFEASAGQEILLSLSIPAIDDLAVFSPVMTLFGPGVAGEESAQLPETLRSSTEEGSQTIPLGDSPRYWFEPFGRRYYWNWEDYYWTAPQSATYRVALWRPEEKIGRYSFVIGKREVFGGEADCFASYHEYWSPLEAGRNPYRDTLIIGDAHKHDHSKTIDLDPDGSPQVTLTLFPVNGGGYNLRLQTQNFIFTPQNVDGDPIPGEGHAHLYIDDVKIARLYGEWHHLESTPEGAETLTVALYANDHSAFTVRGIHIADSVDLADLPLAG
ncbi:MAG: hypothetical protein OXG23_16815 [Chloroflexi bacterium]|nr:hypothetical protein [Chloroflexota bacterium]